MIVVVRHFAQKCHEHKYDSGSPEPSLAWRSQIAVADSLESRWVLGRLRTGDNASNT